jgi:hypothetical protein
MRSGRLANAERVPTKGKGTSMRFLALGMLFAAIAGGSVGCESAGPSRGLMRRARRVSDGYILFSPLLSTTTYLIDRAGKVVHTWESELAPGASVYLLENGHLLRCSRQPEVPRFHGGGLGGRLQEFDWKGDLVWEWNCASGERLQHHDIAPMPNGNVLLIAWEAKTREQALLAGRRLNRVGPDGLWPESIIEVQPVRPKGGSIVWEWHLWDHLIQDFESGRSNYGKISEHPELIDINGDKAPESITNALIQRLKSLGYLTSGTSRGDLEADFVHINSLAYNPQLDQIALSANHYHEIWIIDHSLTAREAAGHSGGRGGRGGDLLYRWGNPGAHGRGKAEDQLLFGPHDARWIPDGCPGAGHLMVFNNGLGRDGHWSSVIELKPPLAENGRYRIEPGSRLEPSAPIWEYTAPDKRSFYADFLSGAHRLADGNTFITSGPEGRFFEVTLRGETVWEYLNLYSGRASNPAGDPPYSVFRATHIPAAHPALAGRDLQPLDPQPPTVRRGL